MRLIAENIDCERGGRRVFSNLSFDVPAGGSLLLTGANGSGKTSLLRLIAGLGEPAGGAFHLEGATDEASIGQRSHYLAHKNGVKTALSVEENLRFWAQFLGAGDISGSIEKGLELFDLAHLAGYSAGLLSQGQTRRLALSRLVLVPRPIWLLDEPSVGLDAASSRKLSAAMSRHMDEGGLLVATTHTDLGIAFSNTIDMGDFS